MSEKTLFNKEQKNAIESFISGKSVFVSASAGTGKTTMLVEAYIRLLEKGARPNEIIAITFTEASANEMLKRTREKLRIRLYDSSDRDYENWYRIYREVVSNSNISTIHAYANTLIKKYALALSLSPQFEIVDSSDESVLKILSESIQDIFENTDEGRYIHKTHKLYLSEDREEFILKLSVFINNIKPRLGSFQAFKEKVFSSLSCEDNTKDLHKKLLNILSELLESQCQGKNIEKAKEKIAKEFVYLEKIICKTQKETDDMILSLTRISENLYGNLGKNNYDFSSLVEDSRNVASEYAKKLFLICYRSHVEKFVLFAEKVFDEYEKLKIKNSVLTFDDIISNAVKLFEKDDIKKEIGKSIKYVILDEAQDTSNLQYNFINLLAFGTQDIDENIIAKTDKRCFIVGDRKQSIYRFRSADIKSFLEYEKYFEKSDKGETVYLKTNYRSESLMIDFFNSFFRNVVFEKDFIGYSENDNLLAGRASSEAKKAVYLVLHKKTKDGITIRTEEETALEAQAFARYIEKARSERDISYSEIALLLPTFTRLTTYLDAFIKYNIPFYVSGGKGFYSRHEIYAISSFLRYLILREEGLITSVLEDGFFDFTISDLYEINKMLLEKGYKSSDCFKTNADEKIFSIFDKHKNLKDKILKTREIILALKKTACAKSASETIEKILEITNYGLYVMTLSDADITFANIQKLIETARLYERHTGESSYNFVQNMKMLQMKDDAYAYVPLLEINAVRVMTIHGSKGLEFPLVFVGGLSHSFRQYSEKFGFIDDEPVIPLNTTYEKTFFSNIDKEKDKERSLSERKRFLYVALTRAKKEIVLAGEAKGTTSYRLFFNQYFTGLTECNFCEDSSESIKDIVSVDMFSEGVSHEHMSLYIFGRGITSLVKKNDRQILSERYEKTMSAIERKTKARKKLYSPKIKISYASSLNREEKQIEYDIESLLNGNATYFEEHNGIIEEMEYETDISVKDLGIEIHKCLEVFDYKKYKSLGNDYLNIIIENSLSSMMNYNRDALEKEIRIALDNYLKNSHASNILTGKETVVFREHSFEKHENKENGDIEIIRAKIDLLTKDESGLYCIIDYKLAFSHGGIKERYKIQMDMYQSFVSQILGIDKNKIRKEILCLKDGKSILFD